MARMLLAVQPGCARSAAARGMQAFATCAMRPVLVASRAPRRDRAPRHLGGRRRRRARAQASVVTGGLGGVGTLPPAATTSSPTTTSPSSAAASRSKHREGRRRRRAPRRRRARAAALARNVDLFDGLVTAERRPRTPPPRAARSAGRRVAGLKIEGRRIGDVRSDRDYLLSDGGSVAVNRRHRPDGHLHARPARGRPRRIGSRSRRADADAGATPPPRRRPPPRPTETPTKAKPSAPQGPARSAQRPLTGAALRLPRLRRGRRRRRLRRRPRQIGPHQGNDVFAPFGAPVLAVADGTVNRVGTLPISGNRLWLHTDGGDAFFYAHLSAFAPDGGQRPRVKAGTVLGFIGNTGDAEPTPPHLHFEIHPGAKTRRRPACHPAGWQERAYHRRLAHRHGDTRGAPRRARRGPRLHRRN